MTGNSAWVRIGKSVGVDDGKGRNSGDDLGDSGPSLGADPPGDPGYGPSTGVDAGRHHLPDAQWLPVEPSAPGTGRRQHYSGPSSAGWSLECWRASGLLRRTGRSGLGMAADCSMGKAVWGGGRHWTQPHRPGQSGEQEEHPGRRGGRTPERGGGWSQCARYETLEADPGSIVVARPEGTQNLCLDQSTVLPSSTHIRRIAFVLRPYYDKKAFRIRASI